MKRTAPPCLAGIALDLVGMARASTCPEPFVAGAPVRLAAPAPAPTVHYTAPAIVWTGTEYGIAAIGASEAFDNNDIYFLRAAGDGRLLGDPVRVAWEDYRLIQPDIYFSRLDQAGRSEGRPG